jgi:simple sugar transport system substrate-binding protein
MSRIRTRVLLLSLFALLALLGAACSSGGGAAAEGGGSTEGDGGGGEAQGDAYTVAMITHAPEGDTFFDLIRAGADAAAAKGNISYEYAADADPSQQAILIQNAIDRGVDGIAVSMPNPDALVGPISQAVEAGIPVSMFNAGFDAWQDTGALSYYGQDETLAGQAAGQRLSEEGAAHVMCVVQEQGQVQLEARCSGVEEAFEGDFTKTYVEGTNMPSTQSTITSSLQSDSSIDTVLTLGAPFALAAVDAVEQAGSEAQVVTFDTNSELVSAIQDGAVTWAVDQQPYLQGYGAIDSLWLYLNNRNVVGGGQAVLTGPSFIDSSNIEEIAELAQQGTR